MGVHTHDNLRARKLKLKTKMFEQNFWKNFYSTASLLYEAVHYLLPEYMHKSLVPSDIWTTLADGMTSCIFEKRKSEKKTCGCSVKW